MEVPILAGHEIDLESVDKLLNGHGPKNLKRYERKRNKMIFYFDEISSDCFTCIKFDTFEEFSSSHLKKLPVKMYDYYEPSFLAVTYYNLELNMTSDIDLVKNECNCYKECGYDGVPVW